MGMAGGPIYAIERRDYSDEAIVVKGRGRLAGSQRKWYIRVLGLGLRIASVPSVLLAMLTPQLSIVFPPKSYCRRIKTVLSIVYSFAVYSLSKL